MRPPSVMIRAGLWCLGPLACAIVACTPAARRSPAAERREVDLGPPPSYRQIAERFNANIALLDRLWSTAEVELKWYEQEGQERKKHFHSGEGHLIMIVPDRVALTVGKLGQTGLWAGCNAERYWLFDLQAEPKNVHFGRHDNGGNSGHRQLAGPIRPRDLPVLLGLVPLPTENPDAQGRVQWLEGKLLVEPPDVPWRLILNPANAMPLRIELLDADGQPFVLASLSLPRRIRLKGSGLPARQWPRMSTHLRVCLPSADATMTIRLQDAAAGPGERRIKDKLFDFDRLVSRHFKIDPENRIDLDADAAP